MPISFNQIPSTLRVPSVVTEFSNTLADAGAAILAYNALLIGQKTSAGTATANTVVGPVASADAVALLAGRGSQLHRMSVGWFANNTSIPVYIGVLADNGAGADATGNFSFTGPATAAGTLSLYIAGQLVSVGVASGDTASTIATNVVAAITAAVNLPVTAAVDGTNNYQVNITARNKGTCGNDFDLRTNYQTGQALPAGVGVTVTAMSGGTTNPVLSTLITAMGDQWFQIIAHPYTDSTSLTAIETEMARRAGPMVSVDGQAITSAAGAYSALVTLGTGRNSPYSDILAQPGANPVTPPPEFAAAAAAMIAAAGQADPARPMQTLPLAGVLPPAAGDLFTFTQRDTLLHSGIATSKVAGGGVVQLERVVTTYQTNAASAPDTSYLDITTLLTLMYLRFNWDTRVQTKYPRHKIAADGSNFGPGQPVITPQLARGEAILWFTEMQSLGLVQNLAAFKASLDAEIHSGDPTRMDWLLPPTLVSPFIVGAAQIQFRR